MEGAFCVFAARHSLFWLLVLCAAAAATAASDSGQPDQPQPDQQPQEPGFVVTSGQTAVTIDRLTGAVVAVTVSGIDKVCNGTQRVPSSSLSLGSEVQLHVDRVAAANNTVTVSLEATRLVISRVLVDGGIGHNTHHLGYWSIT
eukprot:m.139477 g.139477  ORF g.139477 m.139477 type:complete len:144 (+) comp17059_c0_seq4:105-536(+)